MGDSNSDDNIHRVDAMVGVLLLCLMSSVSGTNVELYHDAPNTDLLENKLNPGLGIAFKAKGSLFNNLDRKHLVTVLPLINFEIFVNRYNEFELDKDLYDCDTIAYGRDDPKSIAWSLQEALWEFDRQARNGGQISTVRAHRDQCIAYLSEKRRVEKDRARMLQKLKVDLPSELRTVFPSMVFGFEAPEEQARRRQKRSAPTLEEIFPPEQIEEMEQLLLELNLTLDEAIDILQDKAYFSNLSRFSTEEQLHREKRFLGALYMVIKEGVSWGASIYKIIETYRMSKQVRENTRQIKYHDMLIRTLADGFTTFVHQQVEENLLNLRRWRYQGQINDKMGDNIKELQQFSRALTRFITVQSRLDAQLEGHKRKVYDQLEPKVEELERLVQGIVETSAGRLSPKLINATTLAYLVDKGIEDLRSVHPQYKAVMTQINHYYEIPFISMFYDPDARQLYVAFPIFISQVNNLPLQLYEIETAHVPITDQNHGANSYTRVIMEKPYIAVNTDHYIQLTTPELSSCRYLGLIWYCEERFLVKHRSKFTCASAVFFQMEDALLRELCEFEYSFNKTVVPSILDGGRHLVLANMPGQKYLRCFDNVARKPLPSKQSDYMIIDKETLCGCDVETDLTVIQKTLSSCDNHTEMSPVMYINNAAITLHLDEFQKWDQEADYTSTLMTEPQAFDFFLFEITNEIHHPPDTLRDLIDALNELNMNTTDWEKYTPLPIHPTLPPFMFEEEPKRFWTTPAVLFVNFLVMILTVLVVAALVYLCYKQKFLYSLVGTAAALPKTAAQDFLAQNDFPDFPIEVTCKVPWMTWLFTVSTIIGLVFLAYRLYKMCYICRGKYYNLQGTLMLVFGSESSMVTFPMLNVYGPYHSFTVNKPVTHADVTLTHHWIWDTVQIAWNDVTINHLDAPINAPTSIVVPIMKRWQIRSMFSSPYPVCISACLEQGGF